MSGKFILVCGRSGSGKTSLINSLIYQYPSIYCRPISYTTRKKRLYESEDEYQFITKDALIALNDTEQLLNIDFIYGNYYGILKKDLVNKLENDKIVIKEIHPSNFDKISAIFSNIITICIDCKNSLVSRDPQRSVTDFLYYNTDNYSYDIRFENNHSLSLNQNAIILHNKIINFI